MKTSNDLHAIARLLRKHIISTTTKAGSGHPSSSLSAVELVTSLYFKHLQYDLKNPEDELNDRVIFSKGHASPLFYSLYAVAGVITEKQLMTYRKFDSPLEGHPTPRFSFTEAATGSLGQGLSIGVGQALALKQLKEKKNSVHTEEKSEVEHDDTPDATVWPHVYVLMGDGEIIEGSVWEAAALASHYKLDNLIAIGDINRLGQSDPTMFEHDLEAYRKRFEAFGWGVIVIDGHEFDQIDAAITKARDYQGGPTIILAKTVKGKGVTLIEDKNGWHGKPLPKDEATKAIKALGDIDAKTTGKIPAPWRSEQLTKKRKNDTVKREIPTFEYKKSETLATRKAFGQALARLGEPYPEIVVLDGDVKNSTYTQLFAERYPHRFYESFIAEQNMVGMAVGFARRGYAPWVSSFACFLTRAFDQIRMAGLSGATIRFNGSHAGVSIGADGGSQMGLEDIAMFRAVLGSAVLYPADAVSTQKLTEAMMEMSGISYIRTTRPDTPVIYGDKDEFPIGGSKIHKPENRAKVTVVAAGITLHEALTAQKRLDKDGIGVRVIDCYSVKPIDDFALEDAANETDAIVVVEDHYSAGGIGEAVKSFLGSSSDFNVPVKHLAVDKVPRSGKSNELLDFQGISAKHIEEAVRNILKR